MTKTAETTGDGNKTNDLYATLKAEEHQRIFTLWSYFIITSFILHILHLWSIW